MPGYNIFGLQRLFSDLGGLARAADGMAVPGLASALAEPMAFCELMVFGTLEAVLAPGATSPGGPYGGLDLRRLGLILEKYRELPAASAFAGLHKSKQSEVRRGGGTEGRGQGAGGRGHGQASSVCCPARSWTGVGQGGRSAHTAWL